MKLTVCNGRKQLVVPSLPEGCVQNECAMLGKLPRIYGRFPRVHAALEDVMGLSGEAARFLSAAPAQTLEAKQVLRVAVSNEEPSPLAIAGAEGAHVARY